MDKKAKVDNIVQKLNDDLSGNTLSNVQRQEQLEQLKVLGRDPSGADAIYSRQGIMTLSRYAFGTYSDSVIQEALKVIANALMLQSRLQVALIEVDGIAEVAKLYQQQDDNFEFLGARILFFCTFAAQADFAPAISHGLLNDIERHVNRHAGQLSRGTGVSSPMAAMAVAETSKLIHSLVNRHPSECQSLNAVIPALCAALQLGDGTSSPLDPPTGPVLSALASLDFGAVPANSSTEDGADTHTNLVTRLVRILDEALQHYKSTQLDTLAISLITVLRMVYETSSIGVQTRMKTQFLPADSERDLPLGQSSSLPSRLLRLTTSPGLSHLPEAVSSFLFELSDKDAATFVKNIGYGYAAGYLMTHKIPIPEMGNNAATTKISSDQVPINPVTGQRLDKESVAEVPDMTDEEKEREAERLFVLFERLRATGVINAENPVRQAMQEGRLEEVSDSESG